VSNNRPKIKIIKHKRWLAKKADKKKNKDTRIRRRRRKRKTKKINSRYYINHTNTKTKIIRHILTQAIFIHILTPIQALVPILTFRTTIVITMITIIICMPIPI
jgi:hypothetical protein